MQVIKVLMRISITCTLLACPHHHYLFLSYWLIHFPLHFPPSVFIILTFTWTLLLQFILPRPLCVCFCMSVLEICQDQQPTFNMISFAVIFGLSEVLKLFLDYRGENKGIKNVVNTIITHRGRIYLFQFWKQLIQICRRNLRPSQTDILTTMLPLMQSFPANFPH